MGLLPGCAPSVVAFVAYDTGKRFSKHPERFGKGAIGGVCAPETSNNATSTAGFVPLFSFGLPTAPSMAVMLGALMMCERSRRRTSGDELAVSFLSSLILNSLAIRHTTGRWSRR